GGKLTANDESGKSTFGIDVALSADGNTALIGGYSDNANAGAAWAFTRSGGTWTQQGPKLTGNDETNPASVGRTAPAAGDGNTALAGGYTDSVDAGAAWVFTRSGGTWTQQGPKLASGETGIVGFGYATALSADGNTALIGGPNRSSGAGGAWVFTRSGGAW